MKKNCYNCQHLEWVDGDINDISGFVCNARDYSSSYTEDKHLLLLKKKEYRLKSKKCCKLKTT